MFDICTGIKSTVEQRN